MTERGYRTATCSAGQSNGSEKTFYAREAIEAHLDDLEDFYLAEERLKDFQSAVAISLSAEGRAWLGHLRFLPAAVKELKALDRSAAQRIVKTLEQRIAASDDPRSLARRAAGGQACRLLVLAERQYR